MLLDVQDLRVSFASKEGEVRAVDGISFQLEAGKILGIVGESGCGKSATALSLMRLLPKESSRMEARAIFFEGNDLLGLAAEPMRLVRGNQMGIIFQDPMTSLNPVYTVGFQIAEAVINQSPHLASVDVRARVVEAMRQVGIADAARRYADYPHQLSGGLRQRIMIAMALATRPKLLIADEPTTALDVTIQAQIVDLICQLQSETGMGVILITHDLGVMAEAADEVMVMYAGQIVEKAGVKEIFANPLHPYTKGLLASLPSKQSSMTAHGTKGRLEGIKGAPPDPRYPPSGCRFQERCGIVQPACRTAPPALVEKQPGHWVRCSEVHS